ncbi:MAG: ABC transporter ATP-binding protein [Nitrospinota bacterium]|nr:ABC transporter ATP-binding protein [Nitrospinota bacterium]MDP7502605.1 ABC transporter ATP-binding protein [Nitrospinota bacterium]MDP7664347.1 ABC transporter ATP-binding protein [Nitrospinota bacterium]
MPNQLTISGLKKSFGEVAAVDGLSLALEAGELMVLVGPTGCGKSTLLRLIAGLERPGAGHIYLSGERINDLPVGRRGIQLVFQSYALWPHMPVFSMRRWSNIGFGPRLRRWLSEKILNRVREVMGRVGIDESLAERHPNQLSSGQQQKVAVGRAVAVPPRVFLLDEPMANIDPVSKRQVRGELLRVHEEIGSTTLLVTHDLNDASILADRIAVMRDGRILQVDTLENILRAPADPFVEDFFSSFDFERFKLRRGGGKAE